MPGFEQAYRKTAGAVAEVLRGPGFAAEAAVGRCWSLHEVLAEVQQLLAESTLDGAPRDAPRGTPAGLSERELEVLRLLASGRSNVEIAAE
jgi:DNA-binding NarL/FixJ family response regulator